MATLLPFEMIRRDIQFRQRPKTTMMPRNDCKGKESVVAYDANGYNNEAEGGEHRSTVDILEPCYLV